MRQLLIAFAVLTSCAGTAQATEFNGKVIIFDRIDTSKQIGQFSFSYDDNQVPQMDAPGLFGPPDQHLTNLTGSITFNGQTFGPSLVGGASGYSYNGPYAGTNISIFDPLNGASVVYGTNDISIGFLIGTSQASIFDGSFNIGYNRIITTVVAAVPEPATWATMIIGLGAIGFVMRRNNVTTRVKFA